MVQQLKSSAKVNRKELRGVIEVEEEEEIQVLGFCEWASTGSLLVPRDWLRKRWNHYNLPDSFFPSEVWPSSAYKRSMKYLQDEEFDEMVINGHTAKFRMESGDGFIRHVYLDVFYPEEEIGTSGGEWRQQKLGHFNYDSDSQSLRFHDENNRGRAEEEWKKLVGKAQGLHREMRESHNGVDLNGVLLDFVKEDSTAVPLRNAGAVYFFPGQYQEILEGLSHLWDELNQYKKKGAKCEIVTLPVVDSDNHRELIKRQANELINSKVETVLDAAIERLQAQEEDTAEDIAASVVEEISDTTDIASEYSALLETELSVKREIEKYLDSLEGRREELVRDIAAQVEV